MFRNFLKLTYRHLLRQKGFTFINILGLTVGLTSCILIGLYIADELSYDNFHPNADRIARVTMEFSRGSSPSTQQYAQTGTKVGPQFKRTFPAVEAFTRTYVGSAIIGDGTTHFRENKCLYADSSFLSIFNFPLLKGDPNALRSTTNVLLTASAAKKYFGSTDIIGKTLRINDSKDFTVAGILQDLPRNSQLHFDMVVSFGNLDAAKTEEWWTANWITYLLLRKNASMGSVETQINNYMERPEIRKEANLDKGDYLKYHLEPLKSVHLYSPVGGFEPNGNITYVYVLLLIAVLILAIACFNYTNLAIAQSSSRTGEIGIRKVLGALKGQLFRQFTGESLFVTFIALVLAVVSSCLLLDFFNSLTGKHFVVADILQPVVLVAILVAGIVIGFLAGSYPALVLSGTRLISILRSGFRITGGHAGLRRTLIVLQFVISLFLIITTVVILQQMSYIRNKDLGLDRDHVVVLPIDWRIHNSYAQLKAAVSTLPGVTAVSGSYNLPISATWGDGLTAMTDHGQVSFSITAIPADLNYLSTLNMHLLAGSDFTNADLPANTTGGDTTKPAYRYILNETAVKKLGWTPQEAIGKVVSRGEPGIVKGVVRDFNFASMHQAIGPLMLFADTGFVQYMLVRVGGQHLPQTLVQLQNTWKEYVPSRPFDYHFLDEDYNALYTTEQRTATIFTVFASLAIILACLGLFGLAAISTVQRTREIGIRKVLGADLFNICLLISNSFLRLVLVAILIAAPLAWLAAGKWLEGFAYRISLRFWIFPAAGAVVMVLAFATVSFHALRAATMNPAKSLKTE
ncbi:MAG TPA: ABC transporter permease [Puia sp.]|nr:ABC transporter permease [Puia sp.]